MWNRGHYILFLLGDAPTAISCLSQVMTNEFIALSHICPISWFWCSSLLKPAQFPLADPYNICLFLIPNIRLSLIPPQLTPPPGSTMRLSVVLLLSLGSTVLALTDEELAAFKPRNPDHVCVNTGLKSEVGGLFVVTTEMQPGNLFFYPLLTEFWYISPSLTLNRCPTIRHRVPKRYR